MGYPCSSLKFINCFKEPYSVPTPDLTTNHQLKTSKNIQQTGLGDTYIKDDFWWSNQVLSFNQYYLAYVFDPNNVDPYYNELTDTSTVDKHSWDAKLAWSTPSTLQPAEPEQLLPDPLLEVKPEPDPVPEPEEALTSQPEPELVPKEEPIDEPPPSPKHKSPDPADPDPDNKPGDSDNESTHSTDSQTTSNNIKNYLFLKQHHYKLWEMSASKEFDAVLQLQVNSTNYRVWRARVENA
ncbi:hypothetical protein CVT24_002681 [Panaeolus cyanescens]|uniref:Uncharacterized protein n=1 Tax=Panaeolus cyanescens TaxID=181874 RepID=A0A409YYB9_9AGAR|nr:hypothetical protein CVT24_002681 [Panaeolus cyanescens]